MLYAKNKHVNKWSVPRVTWYVLLIISILSVLNESSSKQELYRHKISLYLMFVSSQTFLKHGWCMFDPSGCHWVDY